MVDKIFNNRLTVLLVTGLLFFTSFISAYFVFGLVTVTDESSHITADLLDGTIVYDNETEMPWYGQPGQKFATKVTVENVTQKGEYYWPSGEFDMLIITTLLRFPVVHCFITPQAWNIFSMK